MNVQSVFLSVQLSTTLSGYVKTVTEAQWGIGGLEHSVSEAKVFVHFNSYKSYCVLFGSKKDSRKESFLLAYLRCYKAFFLSKY